MNWYQLNNQDKIDSPALLFFPERIQHNIDSMIKGVNGHKQRLIPHVKTHKTQEIVRMLLEAGIGRFKCATIAEMEMCLRAGAPLVLIAYQLTGPKIGHLLSLVKRYPRAKLASLVDNLASATSLAQAFGAEGLTANVYVDINNGENRTGHPLDEAIFPLYQQLAEMEDLRLLGLHVYDGHIRNKGFEERKNHSDQDFKAVDDFLQQILEAGLAKPEVISGGSPTFMPAALRGDVFCSPGTTLLWDWGYASFIPEVDLQWAALLMTRVISKPQKGLITTDLGHKAVSAENPLYNRFRFLNLSDYEPIGQSEEHLVLKVKDWDQIQVGDVLYAVPFHVCPSVALYNRAHIVRNHRWVEDWEIVRDRRMSV